MIALWHHDHTFQFVDQVENVHKTIYFIEIAGYFKLILVSVYTLFHLPHHFLVQNFTNVFGCGEHLDELNEPIVAVVFFILGLIVMRNLGLNHNALVFMLYYL